MTLREGWTAEQREMPAELAPLAATRPGGWVAEIDANLVVDPDGIVPGEAILGGWEIALDGTSTGGVYLRNPRYGPVRDDWSHLKALERPHRLVVRCAARPVRGASRTNRLPYPSGASESGSGVDQSDALPRAMVYAQRNPKRPNLITVRRAGITSLLTTRNNYSQTEQEILTVAFTWTATGLDKRGNRRDSSLLEPEPDASLAQERLPERIRELAESVRATSRSTKRSEDRDEVLLQSRPGP